jgi:hypothetical protein
MENDMNQLNYATLEASQRLHVKGIVLETEAVYVPIYSVDGSPVLKSREEFEKYYKTYSQKAIPAPSMAEVWRELRKCATRKSYAPLRELAWDAFLDINSIDRLIDLLIWVTEQRKEEGK